MAARQTSPIGQSALLLAGSHRAAEPIPHVVSQVVEPPVPARIDLQQYSLLGQFALLVHSIDRPPASTHAACDSHVSELPPVVVTVQHVSGAVHGCPLHM
jgi:hypothetical protein